MRYTVEIKVEEPKKEGDTSYRNWETIFSFVTNFLDVEQLATYVVSNSRSARWAAESAVKDSPAQIVVSNDK